MRDWWISIKKNLILSRPDTSRASHLQTFLFSAPCFCHMYTFLPLVLSSYSTQPAQTPQSSFKSFLNTQHLAKFHLPFPLADHSSSVSLEWQQHTFKIPSPWAPALLLIAFAHWALQISPPSLLRSLPVCVCGLCPWISMHMSNLLASARLPGSNPELANTAFMEGAFSLSHRGTNTPAPAATTWPTCCVINTRCKIWPRWFILEVTACSNKLLFNSTIQRCNLRY